VVNREVRQFIAELERRGLQVRLARSGHYHVLTRAGRYVASMSATPSDRRSLANARADIRRRLKKQTRGS
jgi:hypothetical protein